MKLIIMSGAPGCGKSTYACKYVKEHDNTVIVSRDIIRYSLLSDTDEYFSKENEVLNIFYTTIADNLRKGHDVIADASHLSKKARLGLIRKIQSFVPIFDVIVIYMRPSLDICFARNDTRTGRANVPHGAIESMYNAMTDPKNDGYYYERIEYITE